LQTSRETLRVELRRMISCSFLFDFLACTYRCSSWIPVFSPFPLVPSFLNLYSLGPGSPASYTHGSQESVNTAPHFSIKPVSETPPPARRRHRCSCTLMLLFSTVINNLNLVMSACGEPTQMTSPGPTVLFMLTTSQARAQCQTCTGMMTLPSIPHQCTSLR
jgi:hypothetical protein